MTSFVPRTGDVACPPNGRLFVTVLEGEEELTLGPVSPVGPIGPGEP